jgi:hypothetical protein
MLLSQVMIGRSQSINFSINIIFIVVEIYFKVKFDKASTSFRLPLVIYKDVNLIFLESHNIAFFTYGITQGNPFLPLLY